MKLTRTITIEIDTDVLSNDFSLCAHDPNASNEERKEHEAALIADANRFVDEVKNDPYMIMEMMDFFNY